MPDVIASPSVQFTGNAAPLAGTRRPRDTPRLAPRAAGGYCDAICTAVDVLASDEYPLTRTPRPRRWTRSPSR